VFESDFEQREYEKRRQNLNEIVRLTREIARQRDPNATELPEVAAAYPNAFRFTHTIPQVRAHYDAATGEALEASPIEVAIAGRIMAHRAQGKAGFAQLQQEGQRLQIYVRLDHAGDLTFQLYKHLHLGDHIGVTGTLFRTRTGELTVQVARITFLAAAMLPLPTDYYGIEDIEQRYRRRYVDLIMNSGHKAAPKPATEPGAPSLAASSPDVGNAPQQPAEKTEPDARNVREVFVKRAHILRALRTFFDARGYLEVETPMMHTISGGAAARPFETHHNALDIPLKLRIAPELYLKRLVVGGFDRVYEINRNFRNEGVSTQHNPEFTMLEFYQAYANYHDLMDLTEEIITFVAQEVNGTTVTNFNGTEIDLSKWTKLSMREAIIKWWPENAGPTPSMSDFESSANLQARLQTACEHLRQVKGRGEWTAEAPSWSPADDAEAHIAGFTGGGIKQLATGAPCGKVIAELFEYLAEEHLIQPTIIYDFPLAVSPLSKVKPDEPDWVERFEFYIGGFEVGNAFSELNDPEDQRRRFQSQLDERARGDEEAMAEMDDDYVRALGYGLPPTAGEGIGIDRLTMILTGAKSIRDVILFPLLRPQTKAPQHQGDLPPADPQDKPIK
jgi:lysyl-tRNA synthetase class 2